MVADTDPSQHRYGIWYWTTLLFLNVLAVLMGRKLDSILIADAVVLGLFAIGAVVRMALARG